MVSKKTLNTLLASAVALTIAGAASGANAMDDMGNMDGKEKCYGVVKAGANDCANASKSHACAGMAGVDADGGEWIALPTGVCDKLVNGSKEAAVAAPAPAAAAAEAPVAVPSVDAATEIEAVEDAAHDAAADAAHGSHH